MCRCQTQLFLYSSKKVGNAKKIPKHKFVTTGKCSTWATVLLLGIDSALLKTPGVRCWRLFICTIYTSAKKTWVYAVVACLHWVLTHTALSTQILAHRLGKPVAKATRHKLLSNVQSKWKRSVICEVTENGKHAIFRQTWFVRWWLLHRQWVTET